MNIEGCPLARPSAAWKTCGWCGKPLPKYARRWCSVACSTEAVENHSWSYARPAALRRDNWTCQRCGYKRPPEPRWKEFPTTLDGNSAAYWEAHNVWRLGLRSMEVNHKTAILGRHAEAGCHHHLDGLETLCRPCHLEVTARQRREMAAGRRATKKALQPDQGSLL